MHYACEVDDMSIPSIRIGSSGLSFLPVLAPSICPITSKPPVTRPNTVCLLSSQGAAAVVIKNCEPLVLGPALAMDTVKGRSWRSFLSNSSSNSPPFVR